MRQCCEFYYTRILVEEKCEWIEHNISYALARYSKRWGRQDILVIWWRGKRKHYSTLGEQASSSELWGPSTSRFTNWTRSWLKYNWHSFLITKHRRRPSVRTMAGVDLRFQRVFAFVSRLTWLDQGRKAENVFSPNDYAAIIRMPIIKRAVYRVIWCKYMCCGNNYRNSSL